jgi:protein phosphatase
MQSTREIKSGGEIVASVQTDVGCVREANEDSGRHVRPNDPQIQLTKGTLTIVADGMGGHASGEVASQMAVELISELYYRDERFDTGAVLKDAIETASNRIYQTSLTDEKYFGMGTTLVALVLQNRTAYVAHVGDSRVYLLRAGKFQQITEDHSQVMEMVKYGIISREEAKNHEDKNVILRAMGTQPQVEAELAAPFAVYPDDTFLLCSDGLCDMVDDEEMHAILLNSRDVHSACESLVEAAKQSGGHDNITVGIVKITASGEAQTETVRVTREINVEG